MKQALTLLLLLLSGEAVYGQIDWGAYSQSFPDRLIDDPTTVGLILAIPKNNNSFWLLDEQSRQYIELAADSTFRRVRPKNLFGRTTFDTARAHFFLHGVNPGNTHDYQFRVTGYPTKQVLIDWQPIRQFTDDTLNKKAGLPRMAYLGGFKTSLDQTLIVDVRRVGTNRIVASSLISWVSIRPVYNSVYTSDNLADFFRKLQYPWARERNAGQSPQPSGVLRLPVTNTNLVLTLAADIYDREQVQYALHRDGQGVTPWKANDYDNSFVWVKDFEPGTYQLMIRYTAQPQHVTTYPFVVEPAWYQTPRFQLLAGAAAAICLGALIVLGLYLRQRQQARREFANKTKLQLELKSIYAQLNPHFVFNALGSIQGLINRGNIEGANNYLTDFARLMRESLTNSHKDEISLHEEVQALDTYLKLERLRFGFRYEITLAESINRYDTSIPALLLQPLLENAVKHGVATLGEAGFIHLHFDHTDDTMLVNITDNGKGFVAGATTGGFGLKLTRDRLILLNELNRAQPIQLEIVPRLPTGTEIRLRFSHWFA